MCVSFRGGLDFGHWIWIVAAFKRGFDVWLRNPNQIIISGGKVCVCLCVSVMFVCSYSIDGIGSYIQIYTFTKQIWYDVALLNKCQSYELLLPKQTNKTCVFLSSGGSQNTLFTVEIEAPEIFMCFFHWCLNSLLFLIQSMGMNEQGCLTRHKILITYPLPSVDTVGWGFPSIATGENWGNLSEGKQVF